MFFAEKGRNKQSPSAGVLILKALLSSLYLLKGAYWREVWKTHFKYYESIGVHEKFLFQFLCLTLKI